MAQPSWKARQPYQLWLQLSIFRTSWVFAARGENFAKKILRLAQERDRLTIVDDQVGAPTGAELLADVTAHAIRMALQHPELNGLYHLVASGETSWYGYARFVLDLPGKQESGLKRARKILSRCRPARFRPPRAGRKIRA